MVSATAEFSCGSVLYPDHSDQNRATCYKAAHHLPNDSGQHYEKHLSGLQEPSLGNIPIIRKTK